MNRLLACAAAIVLLTGICAFAADTKAQEKAATDVAKTWVGLVDAGKYAESWDAAAALFRAAVTKEQWAQKVKPVREPLGKVVSRELLTAEYKTALPGAPDGEYVVIQFKTVFANKKDSVETITPMKDKDGQWRVSGYYIK
jgi:hypothetical protein